MGNFFKSIFASEPINPEEEKKKEDDKNFEIFKYDGIRAQNMGQLDYSQKCFREALAIREDEEVENHLAQALSVQGKLEEAFDVYNHIVELYPDKDVYFLSLANICFLLDRYGEMLEATTKAIAIENQNPGAFFLQGRAHHGLKDNVMAIADLTQAITLKEDYTEALLLRADVLITMGQYPEAEKDIDVVLSQNESDEDALRLKGKLLKSLGETDKAEVVFRELIETDPFNQQAYLTLGQMLIEEKRIEDAISLFNDAIEINPNFAEAYHERGKAKLLAGDEAGSIEDGKKAMELEPQEADISGQFESQQKKPINILGID